MASADLGAPAARAELGAVRARGAEAVRFLQGQLSQNLERVCAQRSLLAGLHNPQGRVIALLRLLRLAENDFLAVLPRELAQPVAARLSRFVLRTKVVVREESDAWRFRRIIDDGGQDRSWPRELNAQLAAGDSRIVCVGENPVRWLHVVAGGEALAAEISAASLTAWERCEIAAGEPQVYAETSEGFVSQMLNLDLLDAIAFDKGCYTGQEIIARAHYRGRMKRRMQRFSASSRALAPGARGRLADGRSFTVVRAAGDGERLDFLAVTSLPQGGDAAAEAIAAPGTEDELIEATQQPLPYALPE